MKKIWYMAAVILLAACGGKPKDAQLSPETKLALSAFESQVNALGAHLEDLRATAKQFNGEMRNLDSLLQIQVPASIKGTKRERVDEQVKACGELKSQLPKVQPAIDSVIQDYTQAGKAYGEWIAQLKKGELAEEEANTGLEAYRSKLNDLHKRTFAINDEVMAIRQNFAQHLDSAQKLGGFKLK